jgi:NAD(P)-dependent dehydrogenase (short-subunit alcohol dehydrogenase family)
MAFAERGWTVIATMRTPTAADPALGSRSNVEVLELDVTDGASRERLIEEVVRRHGRIDVLVNNAGVGLVASVEDTEDRAERRLFETNYFGPVALIRKVLPIMRAQGGGRIVNVTAIGAIFSTPLLAAYCATKHALDAVSAAVDIEARPFGVRSSSVLPGQYRTSITDKSPPPVITGAYRRIAEDMARSRAARMADVQTDLSPVAAAVLEAATAAEPCPRYLVGEGIADELETCVGELERLHRFDACRAGL